MTADQGVVNEEAVSDPETRHALANAQQIRCLREALARRSAPAQMELDAPIPDALRLK